MFLCFVRTRFLAATIAFSLATVSVQAEACMFIDPADERFWATHATSIVDATIVGFDEMPLTKRWSWGTSDQGATTWVLKLKVHKTIRGNDSDVRFVATRFWNTTIVDEVSISELVGRRREFALVDPSSSNSKLFSSKSAWDVISKDLNTFPRHDGFRVIGANGSPLDEIWEGQCVALPIFRRGTFDN